MQIAARLDAVVDRLCHKIEMSQVPVPGFIVGLSGTDSLVAFDILSRALQRTGQTDRLQGVHYINPAKNIGSFELYALPWLHDRYPDATITLAEPLGGNQDPQRWADLQLRALNSFTRDAHGKTHLTPLDIDKSYWVAGTINATEHALGKHSIGANAVSIQPIRSLWKTDVMEACSYLEVPAKIIEAARIPDCFCGRDEIAAENIELIDDILRYRFDVRAHDPELVVTLMTWVSDMKREGGFRQRIPYIV